MTSTVQRGVAVTGGIVLLSLAALVLLVSIAQAAPPTQLQRAHAGAAVTYAAAPLTQLQRAHAGAAVTYAAAPLTQLQRAHAGAAVTYAATGPAGRVVGVGRGRAFVTTTPVAAGTATAVGGFAVTAFVIALVAFLALGGRSSRRGELAPITSLVQAPGASPGTQNEDRERKAA